MTPEEAFERQQDVVHAPPDVYVRACPGAGKTRSVVDRFLRVVDAQPARAAAVISFTNRASDEVSKRCTTLGTPELAGFPNYVGTFDRFIGTYIVRPFVDLGGAVRIIDSWDALDVSVAANGVQGTVSLDHFEVQADGGLKYEQWAGDPPAQGAALGRLEYNATRLYRELHQAGYMTCDDVRGVAIALLAEHPDIVNLLRERFAEIIIDEAQDCSVSELELLERFRDGGVPLAVVCDPDQSIYEWREADPARLQAFAEDLTLIELTGNWRSTPAICALAATIRGGAPDHPVGPRRDDETAIVIIRYAGWPSPAIGQRFADILADAGIDRTGALILAHGASAAAQVAGARIGGRQTNVATLARSCVLLMDPRTQPRERQHAFDRIQRIVLRMININAVGHTTERVAELAHVDLNWLRRSSLTVARSVGALDLDLPVGDWLAQARAALTQAAASGGREVAAAGTLLPTPQGSVGLSMRQAIRAEIATTGIRHSTVHAAKGTEEEAVLVVLPRDRAPSRRTHDVIAAWSGGEASEPKRVLYVGVTRAEKLCALAVPEAEADSVVSILEGSYVPHVVYEA